MKTLLLIGAIAISGCGGWDYMQDKMGLEFPTFCRMCTVDSDCEVGGCECVYVKDANTSYCFACVPRDWAKGGPKNHLRYQCNHVPDWDEPSHPSDWE